jgi:hypothetical protein
MHIAGYSLLSNPERSMDYIRPSGSEDEKQALKTAALIMAAFFGVGILLSRV